ncbi:MAG TPA: OmpA family protein [Acetobacteraceae bacterium]
MAGGLPPRPPPGRAADRAGHGAGWPETDLPRPVRIRRRHVAVRPDDRGAGRARLAKYPSVNIQIAGNPDDQETGKREAEERSLALGEQRSRNVGLYLEAKGVAPSRITTISYGEDRPTALGENAQARAQNRNAVTSVR